MASLTEKSHAVATKAFYPKRKSDRPKCARGNFVLRQTKATFLIAPRIFMARCVDRGVIIICCGRGREGNYKSWIARWQNLTLFSHCPQSAGGHLRAHLWKKPKSDPPFAQRHAQQTNNKFPLNLSLGSAGNFLSRAANRSFDVNRIYIWLESERWTSAVTSKHFWAFQNVVENIVLPPNMKFPFQKVPPFVLCVKMIWFHV